MSWTLVEPPAKPLPVILRHYRDELLSSWLKRTARFYHVAVQELLIHFGITPPTSIRLIDFTVPDAIQRRLGWCLRTSSSIIRNRRHVACLVEARKFISLHEPISSCAACDKDWSAETYGLPVSRSWFECWRVACGKCRRPFHRGPDGSRLRSESPDLPKALWLDAKQGSALFDRYIAGRACKILSPELLLRLASARMSRWSGAETGFKLIVPETVHPAFGAIHSTPVTSIRTKNPFRRIALLAALYRVNYSPSVWIDELINSSSNAGIAAIMTVLDTLPGPIEASLTRAVRPRSGRVGSSSQINPRGFSN